MLHLTPLLLAIALTAMFLGAVTSYTLMEYCPPFRACVLRVLRAGRWMR